MKSISLKRSPLFSIPTTLSGSDGDYPHVYLDDLKGVAIPEEGTITFEFKRKELVGRIGESNSSLSAQICLCTITDVKEKEIDDAAEEVDASGVLDDLMASLVEADMIDESEDDNPSKY